MHYQLCYEGCCLMFFSDDFVERGIFFRSCKKIFEFCCFEVNFLKFWCKKISKNLTPNWPPKLNQNPQKAKTFLQLVPYIHLSTNSQQCDVWEISSGGRVSALGAESQRFDPVISLPSLFFICTFFGLRSKKSWEIWQQRGSNSRGLLH